MTNNSLSIYTESEDIFYNDFNTKENFYNTAGQNKIIYSKKDFLSL